MNKKPEISDISYSIVNPDGTTALDKDLYIKDLDEYFTLCIQEMSEAATYDDGYDDGFEAGGQRVVCDIITMIRDKY